MGQRVRSSGGSEPEAVLPDVPVADPLTSRPADQHVVLGATAGTLPNVTVANTEGTTIASFLAYGATFLGGVNVAG